MEMTVAVSAVLAIHFYHARRRVRRRHALGSVWRGFSELKTQTSPDTGTTTFVYDSAGNVSSHTDARGKVTNTAYDALNRPTAVTYPTQTALNTVYAYDTAASDCLAGKTFATGRLSKSTVGIA
jgi:YD repeat-containing protein